ncbi:hypothetical protein [Chitinimonas koreensis]|uniref:hypothetical protein n=1 Tax=Chitinimonas koreensis TaxID=356302 RepID=UPI001654B345|nr:hypothetical protein [Chitinimonas koreensis]QNM98661.1 hypothetical protein H9L41_10820 [Chitinimonas koreensis]
MAAGGGIDWALDLFGGPADSRPGYRPESDPRRHVPRRLAITPVLDGDEPAATPLNIRTPWLWPGAAYPLPANATALRGRVLRGPDLASAAPARWARVVATVPASETDFSLATRVGHGHADERGEYVLALDARAVSGAALSNPVQVRLWAFTTPAALPVDPLDPLADLPREACGTDVVNDVLRGIAIPPAYSASVSQLAAVRLGETASGAVATLLVS